MLSKLWQWLAIAASVAAGVLVLLLKIAHAQKAAAKLEAQREKVSRKAVEATQAAERDIDRARAEVREEAAEAERGLIERRKGGRRGRFGDRRLDGGDDQ